MHRRLDSRGSFRTLVSHAARARCEPFCVCDAMCLVYILLHFEMRHVASQTQKGSQRARAACETRVRKEPRESNL